MVEEIEDVTILYADIVGFTKFCKSANNSIEVVKLLSLLFS